MLKDRNKEFSNDLKTKLKIIKKFGFSLSSQSVFMDFGCGSGKMVKELCDLGYQAFGCGTRYDNEEGIDTEAMIRQGTIRIVNLENYILPFEDNTFDFIFSNNVFEHVQNYQETISELARVLKPGGYCLHFFPSRWRPIESHIYVPFSSVIQSNWWLYFWVLLGIRNEWQDCNTIKERNIRFYNYLRQETNYLSRQQLTREFGMKFNEVIFCEKEFLQFSRRGKYVFAMSRILPFVPYIYSTFRSRVILTRHPNKEQN